MPTDRNAESRLFISLMSGTSVDAIDVVLARIAGRVPAHPAAGAVRATVLRHVVHPWPKVLRSRILGLPNSPVEVAELCALHFAISRHFSAAVGRLLRQEGLEPRDITAIASHGQTVCHRPPLALSSRLLRRPGTRLGSTLQLGNVAVIATLTGIPTIGDFRAADMAVGGQGAPLVPLADKLLLTHATRTRAIQNIGGIANVTWLPPGRQPEAPVLAFDTGPGNVLLDGLTRWISRGRQSLDRDGAMARRGRVRERLLAGWRQHPFFRRRPPKSTGREEFGAAQISGLAMDAGGYSPSDLLATAAELTAWSIADAYQQFLPTLPEEVILCGGGANNSDLMRRLVRRLRSLGCRRCVRIDTLGIPNQAKEALSFALLAAATLDGVPGNLPSVTGARRAVRLGVIAMP